MKKLVIIFFGLLLSSKGFSQLKLKIINKNQEPIAYCKVVYWTENKKNIAIANLDGEIFLNDINCRHQFNIEISAIGYKKFTDSLLCETNKIIVLEENIHVLNQVCVTGEYAPTTTENSVNKITIITKEIIINSGAVSLVDVLNYQTNIRIGQDNILGSSIEMGGMSGDNVKILIDGLPVIGRVGGNIDLSQINLDNVERIEIVNGPLSVNYGTNALAGTINIITKKSQLKGWSGSLLAFYESVGNYNLTGELGYRFKNQTFKFNGGRKYFDGWDLNDNFIKFPEETLADTNRAIQWNPKLQYLGNAQYILKYRKWQINPFFRYYYEKITNRGFPSSPYYESAFDDYYYTFRIDNGINISKQLNNGNLKIIGGYNFYKRIKNTYLKNLTNLNQILTNGIGDQDTSIFDQIAIRTTYSSELNKWYNFQVGIDVNYESTHGQKIKGNYQKIGDYAIFGSTKLNFFKDKLLIKPGFRYAYNTVYISPITPSLNLKYTFKNVNLRVSVSNGFRSPTLKELFFNFVDINHNIQGNDNLLAEKSWNYMGSITWLSGLKKNVLFKASTSLFYNSFHNLITLGLTSNGSYSYINIGEYSTVGFQSEFTFRNKNLNFTITPTYLGRENYVNDPKIGKYSFSPEVGVQFGYTFANKNWGVNFFYKYNGEQNQYILDSDDQVSTSTTRAYSILDISLSRKLFNKKTILVFGAKNLFNVTNINVSGVNSSGTHSLNGSKPIGRGTSVFISIRHKFQYSKNEK